MTHVYAAVQGAQFSAVGGIYNYSYPETAPEQGVDPPAGDILQTECTNSSGDPLESATYTITSGNSNPFQINTTTGQLSWRQGQVLDYETVTFYWFSIECVDNSDQSNTATAIVNVSVLPINEFVPVITSRSTITLQIIDEAPVGTVIVSTEPGAIEQYTVQDLDDGPDGQITFTLPDQSNSNFLRLFQLNSITGALSIAQSLVNSTSSIITGRITVCDSDPPRDECPEIAVSIFIVAEHNPMFNRSSIQLILPESAEIGTLVAETVCSDRESGFGYEGIDIHSVSPVNHANVFELNSTEDGYGVLVLQQPLDYEVLRPRETVNVTLRCSDNQPTQPSEDFVEIVINVLPVNDNAPRFNQTRYSFTINLASSVDRVCCVLATDADRDVGNQITYSLNDIQRRFSIQSNGEITFVRSALSDRVGITFIIDVTASDGEFDTTAQASISVIDDRPSSFGVTEIVIVALCGAAVILAILIPIVCCYCCLRNHNW